MYPNTRSIKGAPGSARLEASSWLRARRTKTPLHSQDTAEKEDEVMEKKSILIVDDDKAILKSLKEILELEGYSVDTAETGQEATKASKEKYFNLALLDIKLPDMEGTELLSKLYESEPRIMKIMLTGYPSLENAIKSVNLRADAYLTKPVKRAELLKVIADKLKEQEEAGRMSDEKVATWIKTRATKLGLKPDQNKSKQK